MIRGMILNQLKVVNNKVKCVSETLALKEDIVRIKWNSKNYST